mmetsp:Transcript_41892/g.127024  ORF Transcript_41892/g.127024 Transcript_41892/m.127024 type:complete len:208 (-) Transcript_41892:1113-1736(-)
MINVGLQVGEVPHGIRYLTRCDLEYYGPQPHHEAVTTSSAVPVDVNEVLVLGLLINGREVMLSRREGKVFLSQKSHGTVSNLLVAKIPTDDLSVEERFVPALLRVVFPFVAQVSHHDALVIVYRRPSPCRRPAEEGRRDTVLVPAPFELAKVGLREEVARLPIKDSVALSILSVHKGLGKDEAAGSLPILRARPGDVAEPLRRCSVK